MKATHLMGGGKIRWIKTAMRAGEKGIMDMDQLDGGFRGGRLPDGGGDEAGGDWGGV